MPKAEQKAYNWLTNYLQRNQWESRDFLYLNIKLIIQSFVLRNSNAVIYAKAKEKTEFLAKYLDEKLRILMNWAAQEI